MIPNRKFLLVFFLLFNTFTFAQFKISQLSSNFAELNDSLFLGLTKSRNVILLNDNWKAFFSDEPENSSNVSFPLTFTSDKIIIFEKKLNLEPKFIVNNYLKLNFLGINYVAEIFLNNANLYKHPGGEIPFSIDIPENILNIDQENVLRIKIQYSIDSKNTIPLLQRFLFPISSGGILRDIYLSSRPKVGIKNIEHTVEDDSRPYEKRINFKINFENFTSMVQDSLLDNYDERFKVEALLNTTNDSTRVYFNIWNIDPLNKENPNKEFYVRLRNFYQWSNNQPISYILTTRLTNGEGFVFDEMKEVISFLDIQKRSKELFINNEKLNIHGTTLIRNYQQSTDYKNLDKDIETIKSNGFNSIRFKTSFPHPYLVYLTQKYGLNVLIDIPLNSVPVRFVEDNNFKNRAYTFLKRTIDYYNIYPNVIAYSVGGSYLGNSSEHLNFLSEASKIIKEESGRLAFVSLIGMPENNKLNADLCGIELFAWGIEKLQENISNQNESDSLIYFISEATYPTYKGATNGYLNKYSFEAQAKFFDDVISLSENSSLSGFVLNSMFDFYGDYAPMFSGFNEDNLYNIGIFPSESNEPRISYNVIKSRLATNTSVSIPIGNNEEDSPLLFIITALIISVIIALLINSKRKFREDTTRALLRPYNFYADIRDQRILSGFHSNILMLLLAGSNALLITILLYFFKNDLLFNKLTISFGNYKLSEYLGYLAFHPNEALMYSYVGTIILFILISIFIHASSFFVKTRVLYSSVYAVLIWAFLPLALLLPIEAILYKILLTHTYNYIAYSVLILFLIWNIQRVLKGIYVIFDVRPLFVYSYAFLTLIILIVGIGLYYQYTVSIFDYIHLAVKQYINM